MRGLLLVLVMGSCVAAWAQSSSSSSSSSSSPAPSDSASSSPSSSAAAPSSQTQDSDSSSSGSSSSDKPGGDKPAKARVPNLAPPRSDRVDADSLGDEPGVSSSKDTQIDLSPPPDDVKSHPKSADLLKDEGTSASGDSDVSEFRPWDPHKAAKDVEVGDFYFKRKNFRGAEDRYREALYYKSNDAIATFRLATCLEKLERPDEARQEYENYLKILPHGPQAGDAQKAIQRIKATAASAQAK
jgi:hypothetical protein